MRTHLLFLLAALLPAAFAATIPYWQGNQTYLTVCTSEYTPMVSCPDDTIPEVANGPLYSGYEVEVAKKVFTSLGWTNKMIQWTCMDWDEMVGHLEENDGVCDLAVGLMATSEYIESGIIFSWPTYSNGLGVAILNQRDSASMWAFMDAFAWQVWLAIGLTCLAVGLLVWVVDWIMSSKSADNKKHSGSIEFCTKDNPGGGRKPFSDYIWEALSRPMSNRDHIAASLPGNLIILLFGFMILVLVILYTANTTANITATRLRTTIRGLEDLPGKSVATWTDYQAQLTKYGIVSTGYPWDNEEDEDAMFGALTNGTVQALVLDASLLEYIASSSCEIAVVGQSFDLFDQAIAFPKGFDNSPLLLAISQALVSLQESGDLTALQERYIHPKSDSACKGDVNEESTKITMQQVAGLWVMLAFGIAIALGLVVFYKLHERYTQRHLNGMAATMQRSLTRVLSKENRSRRLNVEGLNISDGVEKRSASDDSPQSV